MANDRAGVQSGGRARARGRAASYGALIVLCAWCAPAALFALSADDLAFANYLIGDLKYFDTAARWLDSLEKGKALDLKSQEQIAGLRIDILKAQGKEKEALQAVEEFKKRFPNSARASMGELEIIGVALSNATKLLDQSIVQPKEKAAESVAKAEKIFADEVAAPLDALIAGFQQLYDAVKPPKNPAGDAKVQDAARVLQHAELARVNIYLLYAQKLPRDLPRRAELLGKGAKLAAKFVDERYDFPVMQYRAQLQLGIYAFELGQFAKAEEYLELLYNAEPPLQKPFAKLIVDAFKSYRLQAILFGSRAAIAQGGFKRALDLIEKNYFKCKKDEFDLSRAEDDPDLRNVATLVRLEYGAALCGVGLTARGLAEIHGIINKPGQPVALVTDGRKALGRVAGLGNVRLSGKDYYEAGLGLKSELKWDAALYTFQTALIVLDPRNEAERNDIAPRALNEIGEIYYLKGQFLESALAYEEACRHFGKNEHEILGKVATNMLSAVTKAIQARDDGTAHAGLAKLREEAVKYNDKFGGEMAILQNYMLEAKELINQGQFRAAVEKYKQVPAVYKGQKVQFYWQAQAGIGECVCRMWAQAQGEEQKQLEPELVKVLDELAKIVDKAIAADDKVGAGKAAFFRGQTLYQRGEWDAAIGTLTAFTDRLVDEKVYRGIGLAVLCLAEAKKGDPEPAAGHFKELQRESSDLPAIPNVAAEIADAFEAAGNAARCAEFTLIYARHPGAASDMAQAAVLGQVTRRLIDGGKLAEAKEFLDKLKATGKEGDAALDRTIMYLEAKALVQEKKLDEGIAKFRLYLDKFKPKNDYFEDPYVWHDLAVAYLARRAPGKSAPSSDDMQQANTAYNAACGMMRERAARAAELENTFWDWALEFWKLRMTLADGGAINNYRDLRAFVAEYKDSAMGGHKAEFLEMDAHAAAKLGAKEGPKAPPKASGKTKDAGKTKTTGKDSGTSKTSGTAKDSGKTKTTGKDSGAGKSTEKAKSAGTSKDGKKE